MAVSKVDICNKAIGILGAKPIAALTEQSNNAIRLNAVYDTVRDSVLRAHAWGFATMIESLAQISGETVAGWTYLYAKPSQCVKINKVFTDDSATNPNPTEFEEMRSPVSGVGAVACNDSPAYIKYTFRVDDPTLYSSDFIECFAYKLAGETAYLITGNADFGRAVDAIYDKKVSEAKRNDASGKNVDPSVEESTSSYETARL